MQAIVLLSGGIDSMACVNFYMQQGYDVEGVFCNYGQPGATPEYSAALKIAEYFHIPLRTIETINISIPENGEICGRNALLVQQALCYKGKQSLGHKQLCEKHQLAGKMYANAKLDLASKISEWDINPVSDSELLSYLHDHYNALNDLPQIPEKYFGRLKHAHQAKVELSKFLDSHPNDFWLVCKIKFRLGIDLPSEKKEQKDPASKGNNQV